MYINNITRTILRTSTAGCIFGKHCALGVYQTFSYTCDRDQLPCIIPTYYVYVLASCLLMLLQVKRKIEKEYLTAYVF